MTFALHPRLAANTLAAGDLDLCTVRLMNDARFPWLILIPRRPDLVEIFDLTAAERTTMIEELAAAAQVLRDMTSALKMNVGALGNLVPQLHLHVVARSDRDAAWPGPVWGAGQAVSYAADAAATLIGSLSRRLTLH